MSTFGCDCADPRAIGRARCFESGRASSGERSSATAGRRCVSAPAFPAAGWLARHLLYGRLRSPCISPPTGLSPAISLRTRLLAADSPWRHIGYGSSSRAAPCASARRCGMRTVPATGTWQQRARHTGAVDGVTHAHGRPRLMDMITVDTRVPQAGRQRGGPRAAVRRPVCRSRGGPRAARRYESLLRRAPRVPGSTGRVSSKRHRSSTRWGRCRDHRVRAGRGGQNVNMSRAPSTCASTSRLFGFPHTSRTDVARTTAGTRGRSRHPAQRHAAMT